MCRSIIRTVWELHGFFKLYKEFHHDSAEKCFSFETKIDPKTETDLKIGKHVDSDDLENFRAMSPIDVIGVGELVLEI